MQKRAAFMNLILIVHDMTAKNKKNGHIVTFYSYKGGTGRSMALSNIAVLLAQNGKKVLMVDWDLEAPGLPKYFRKFLSKGFEEQEGLIDFFYRADKELPEIKFDSNDEAKLESFFPCTMEYVTQVKATNTAQNLFLLKSGREKAEGYADQIGSFGWVSFFYKIRSFFTKWAEYLSGEYDYVLIDSRTGHTDTGGICTMQMPDKLVLVFTPNHQSFEGTSSLARKAVQARRRSHDLRPLMVYFLPSRIELNEDKLRMDWLLNYQNEITKLYSELYEQPNINLENYVKRVQIRHASSYAYEEKLAVLEEKVDDTNSLSKVYRDFGDLLTGETPVWMFGVNNANHEPVKIFVAYARNDKESFVQLRKHLLPLERTGKIKIWSDDELIPGKPWEPILTQNLNSADIILVLVSVDALNSQYLWGNELKIALERHEQGKNVIVPIILRYCLWQETILRNFQVLPTNARPVEDWPSRDQAYHNIASALLQIIEERNHA